MLLSDTNTSYTKITNALPTTNPNLDNLMEQMDITGISALFVTNGKIDPPLVKGTIQSTKCGLLKMKAAPEEKELQNFFRSYYILTDNALSGLTKNSF